MQTDTSIQPTDFQNTHVTPFDYQSNSIRVIASESGEPWFVAADICAALTLKTEQIRRLDEDEKGLHTMQTLGGKQEVAVINESGLYHLILTSRKPEAKKFRKWVTAEVLPEIRRSGTYSQSCTSITPAQQNTLQQMIKRKSGEDKKKIVGLWSRFNNHFKLGSYKQLPSAQFEEAVLYLDRIAEDAPAQQDESALAILARAAQLAQHEDLVILKQEDLDKALFALTELHKMQKFMIETIGCQFDRMIDVEFIEQLHHRKFLSLAHKH